MSIDQSSQLVIGKKCIIVDNGLNTNYTNFQKYLGTECEVIKISAGDKVGDPYQIVVKLHDNTTTSSLLVRSLFNSDTFVIDTVNRHAATAGDYAVITRQLVDFNAGQIVRVLSVDKKTGYNTVRLDNNSSSKTFEISKSHMVRVVRKDIENVKIVIRKSSQIPVEPVIDIPPVDYSLVRILVDRVTEDAANFETLSLGDKSRHYKESLAIVLWLSKNGNPKDHEYKLYMKTLDNCS